MSVMHVYMYENSIWYVRPFSQSSISPQRMIKFKGIRWGVNERRTGVLSKQEEK